MNSENYFFHNWKDCSNLLNIVLIWLMFKFKLIYFTCLNALEIASKEFKKYLSALYSY